MNSSNNDGERVGFAFWTQVNRYWLIESKDPDVSIFTSVFKDQVVQADNENPLIAFIKRDLYCDNSELCVEDAVATELKHDKLTLILDANPSIDLLNLETHECSVMTRKGV